MYVRYVAKATSKAVNWYANTKTVTLTSQGTTEPTQTPDNTQKENSSYSTDSESVNIRYDFYLIVDKPTFYDTNVDLIAIKFDYTNKIDYQKVFSFNNKIKVY